MQLQFLRRESDRWLSFLLAAAVVLVDRATKLDVRQHLALFESLSLVPGCLRLVHAENPGAAFSFLADSNPILRNIVLIGVSSAVLVFVISALFSHTLTRLSRTGLALVMGGALGNLYDRVVRHTVTDFIEVYHGGWTFPAFNVADSAITIGATLLILDLLLTRRSPAPPKHVSQAH
jgi:signal peptidase II